MNSKVAMRSNSYHNKKLYRIDSDDFFSSFKVNNPNIKDTKIMFNNKFKTIIQKKLNKSDDEDDENPKTIKNLSKQLMKKIQKKFIKAINEKNPKKNNKKKRKKKII